ncbi:MAG: hypothetical protein ABFS39_17095, partial [Pseudomonadota bacterium]
IDGAETPEYLNAIGQWLSDNVANNQAGLAGSERDARGIWCTNCHNQLSQEIWKKENMEDLVHDVPGPGATNIRALASLDDIAATVGVSTQQAIDWLDPRDPNVFPEDGAIRINEETMAIWRRDPGLCAYLGGSTDPALDANVATIEVAGAVTSCTTGAAAPGPDCNNDGASDFQICGSFDGDGDFTVNILDFCTVDDCVAAAQAGLSDSMAAAVPFSAATDGRDHWLAAGEPHCADCHQAPFVEQSGHINAYSPFNYPRKASLMRYSRGHRDITCQGCHESIHGLYPVAPDLNAGPGFPGVDTTSYAQAAYLNSDDSHGPVKCGSCHITNTSGVHDRIDSMEYDGKKVKEDFDTAVAWAHTFTDEHDPRQDFCINCHEDENDAVSVTESGWLKHTMEGRISRKTMDQTEELVTGGYVYGARPDEDPLQTVCTGCHDQNKRDDLSCYGNDGLEWKLHLTEGRVAEVVWENVAMSELKSTCGW